jgi:hypothetical protein
LCASQPLRFIAVRALQRHLGRSAAETVRRVGTREGFAQFPHGCDWATGLGFLWSLFQSSKDEQEALWNRRGRLVFPQLAERTTHPIDGGFTSYTLFE